VLNIQAGRRGCKICSGCCGIPLHIHGTREEFGTDCRTSCLCLQPHSLPHLLLGTIPTKHLFSHLLLQKTLLYPTFLRKSGLSSLSCKAVSVATPHTNQRIIFIIYAQVQKAQMQFSLFHPV